MPWPNTAALVQDWTSTREAVQQHKAAIRQHRQALQDAAAHLAEIETMCARLGIRLIQTRTGEEETHGHHAQS